MKITLKDGQVIDHCNPVFCCTGYAAKSIEMQPGDFIRLLELSHTSPTQFAAVMRQLDGRINRISNGVGV